MFGLAESLVKLATDATRVLVAPVQIAVEAADAAIKPIADASEAVVDEVKTWSE